MAKKYKKQDSEQATTKATPNIIVNKITSIAPNRQAKDVGSLKSAIINAESRIVPNRAQLYDLYNDVVSLDGRLSGLLEKRTAFVVNKSLKFVRNGVKVEELDELINSEKFNSLLSMLMDSVYWGCTGPRPQAHFLPLLVGPGRGPAAAAAGARLVSCLLLSQPHRWDGG